MVWNTQRRYSQRPERQTSQILLLMVKGTWESSHQSSVLYLAGRGKVVRDAVQQQLHALVLVRAAHEDGHKGQADRGSSAHIQPHITCLTGFH